jgi:hypothetical protein
MKYLKLFEYVKDLEIGKVYKIQPLFIASHMLDDEDRKKYLNNSKRIINYAEILSLNPTTAKTYFVDDHKEYITKNLQKRYIQRPANPKEVQDFELIGAIKKYNL